MSDRAAIEQLASGDRSTSVPPPAKPAATQTVASVRTAEVLPEFIDLSGSEENRGPVDATPKPLAKSKSTKKRPTRPSSADRLLGRERGSRQEIQVRISGVCAEAIYRRAEAERVSLGTAAMGFVRAVHRELRAEATWDVEADDGFAPVEKPLPRQLAPGGVKQVVSLRISPAEAAAMADLAEEVRMSLPLILDEAVRRSPSEIGGLAGAI